MAALYGDGGQVRDWLHVDDHCAGVELVLREGRSGEIYNVGGGNEIANRELTRRILELTDRDESLVRHVSDRPGHDRRYALDTSKLRALGWEPRVPFADGLAATVAWYRDNRAWWEPLKSGEYRDFYEQQYAARLTGEPLVPPWAPSSTVSAEGSSAGGAGAGGSDSAVSAPQRPPE